VRRFTSTQAIPLISGNTEITLLDIPKHKLMLRLFVENEARVLQRKDNQTWALVQRPYVTCLLIACNHWSLCVCRDISPTSQICVDIQMKHGDLPWAMVEQASKEIDLGELYDDYWTSKAHELALQSES